MYKKLKRRGTECVDAIMRLSDHAIIPNDPQNRDWIIYQAWLRAGNTPEAA